MQFAHPQVLWLALLLPLLAVYDLTWGLRGLARFRFSSLLLLGRAGPDPRGPRLPQTALRILVLALLLLVLARPQAGQSGQEILTAGTDIMLCLDTSTSMEALDFQPKNRLDAAKDVIQDFVKNRKHDRIGLVIFAGLAFTQCPLTTDAGALLGFLDRAHTGMILEDGTAVGTGIATAVARLKSSEAKSKVVILLTDGRNNRGAVDPVTAAKTAAAFGIKIHAVGVGKRGESLYPIRDPIFGVRYERLREDMDEPTLRQVAELTGGQYFRATDLEGLKNIYREIDKMEKTNINVKTFTDYRDLYPPFLWAAFLLFAAEVTLAQTLWRRLP